MFLTCFQFTRHSYGIYLVFLGITVDESLKLLLGKRKCTKKELSDLTGFLNFVCKVVVTECFPITLNTAVSLSP